MDREAPTAKIGWREHEERRNLGQEALRCCQCPIPKMTSLEFCLCTHGPVGVVRSGKVLPLPEWVTEEEKTALFKELWSYVVWLDKQPPAHPYPLDGKGWSFIVPLEKCERVKQLLTLAGLSQQAGSLPRESRQIEIN
jgi:hypothetical protein